ncbi:transglycosylase domain-containing protein [Candidatus Raskinella chloraquaticus]|uniref:Penicillin-binding protein n=3 Tax=Candidatus Raskinella chloraquaticus TaxID=1951219 RepID=A0A1W9HQI4_9HYPH|nr:MAG: penicillin-binding protein [Proteobacteria bacterium SG_bin8]
MKIPADQDNRQTGAPDPQAAVDLRSMAPKTKKSRWSFGLLEIDSMIDDTLYRCGAVLKQSYDGFTVFMDRFGVVGVKRIAVEFASDGLTFAVLGGMLLLAFAKPAFEYAKVDWRSAQDYAIVFLDRAGNEIGQRGIRHTESVRLEDIPAYLVQATLATEDRRFFEHFGIDVPGTARAIVENARHAGIVQGGSSLTQQLAKNLFLSNERTIERKIREAFLALWLEVNLSKREILKTYLDRAYMGGGAFGVEAASNFYFGKSVRDISLAEAAMLAGLFKAPSRYAPHINLPAARGRANQVLTNLVEAGYLTEGQVWGARRNPATPVARRNDESPNYFLDWAFDEVKRLVPRGERTLTVKTTIDVNLQRRADQAIEDALRKSGDAYDVDQGALVSLDIDGSIRAMVGGRDYGSSQFNRAVTGQRQTGSSFKPYVYLTAFMNGYSPKTAIVDAPITIGNWSPKNYSGGYSGAMNLTEALVRSINTVPVRLTAAIGRAKIIETVRKAGIESELPNTPSLPLGVADLTVIEMAQGYAHFASGGKSVKAHGIVEIRNPKGDILYRTDRDGPPQTQVFPPKAVADLVGVMVEIVERGTATRAQLDGIRAAGKTGTTNAYRDAWFVGYTGNFTTAVWFGNDDSTPMNRMTGGTLPAMTWQEFMSHAHRGVERRALFGVADEPLTRLSRATLAGGVDVSAPASVAPLRSLALSKQSAEVLKRIERQLRSAPPLTVPSADRPDARLSALPQQN